MAKSRSNPDEKALIDILRKKGRPFPSTKGGVMLGIGDDCALLCPPVGHSLAVTTDFSLETIHFRREWHSPESVGYRCLARGISDLAAMGAKPLAAFLSLALPPELVKGQPSWRDRFFDGFLALAERLKIPLAGGDTAQSPRAISQIGIKSITGLALADITAVGSVVPGQALLRSGAKAGDHIYVTGSLGGAAAELRQLQDHPGKFRNRTASVAGFPNSHPHLFPEPRLAVGLWLSQHRAATAAIDISDGLSTDLHHICEECGLAASIDLAAIPVHPLAKKNPSQAMQMALHGGEDYELLFTASPNRKIPKIISGVPITKIGIMERLQSGKSRVLLTEVINGKCEKRALEPDGWEHYKS